MNKFEIRIAALKFIAKIIEEFDMADQSISGKVIDEVYTLGDRLEEEADEIEREQETFKDLRKEYGAKRLVTPKDGG